MPNSVNTQQALAFEPGFRVRLRAALIKKAFLVQAETPPAAPVDPQNPTPAEAAALALYQKRVGLAHAVMSGGLDRETERIAPLLVMRTNLMAFETSYDFNQVGDGGRIGRVVTAAGDPDIDSQIATDWNIFAGA